MSAHGGVLSSRLQGTDTDRRPEGKGAPYNDESFLVVLLEQRPLKRLGRVPARCAIITRQWTLVVNLLVCGSEPHERLRQPGLP